MDEKCVAVYHRIMRRENFETAAKDLFDLLLATQKREPNRPRILYVDIDGHRNKEGGFDRDMFELQKEFALKFLMPFFTEMNFPLYSIKNPKKQINDIPSELRIFNADSKKEDELKDLLIEDYSNTEFMSEKDVNEFLKHVSAFILKYNELDTQYILMENEPYDTSGWLHLWRIHMKNLVNELFNLFSYGNLLSVSAMTRSLIECYVYISILKKEKNPQLIEDWYLCSTISGCRRYSEVAKDRILESVKNYCAERDLDYDKIYDFFRKGNENTWLHSVIDKKRITFRDACEYLGEEYLYSDFQGASAYVHWQDIVTKLHPFTFYSSIYYKLYLMMSYTFKAIRLYPLDEELEEDIENLEMELIKLAEKYNN